MPILINDNTARVQYTATAGQTVFIVPYEFFEVGDLKVYNGDTLLAYNVSPSSASQYSVTGAGVTGGGSITLGAPGAAVSNVITIVRDIPIKRITDFPNAGPFNIQALNAELDKLTAVQQNLETDLDNRVIRLGDSDTPNTLSALPNKAARQNKLLGFDVQGQPTAYDAASLATLVAYATAYADTFTGDGIDTTFTLSGDPAVIANLDVSINGVTQVPLTDYTLSGTTLTTTTAVPNGAVMLVKFKEGLPNSSGAAQDFALTPNGYTTAINVQAGFDNLGSSAGTSKVGFIQAGTGAQARPAQAKLRETVSVKDFGAVGDGVADDTAEIQAAIDAAPEGGAIYFPNGTYAISAALIVDKAITLYGDGPGKWYDSLGGSIIKQTDITENVFTLRASLAQYAFGQYGLNNVNFRDLAITGPSVASKCARGIGCDTTVNGGDYHIRECTFTNIQVRFCQTGVELVGICYLNDFYGGVISQCDTGFALYRGAASDGGGQTRFFGTTIDIITDACVQWNTDTTSGDLSMFGCTLADAQYGIISNEEAQLTISGCSFENNTKTGSLGAGIYIEVQEASPASDSAKTIIGNKFSFNDASIWIDKTTVNGASNTWSWPMLIDGNTFVDATALRITLPAAQIPMSAQNFVLGAANAGTNAGYLASSQISTNFAGRNMRQQVITRQFAFGPTTAVSTALISGMVVTGARVYLSANSTVFTNLFVGDADDNQRYAFFDAQAQALNTWVNYTPTVPPFVINSDLKQNLIIGGTAGLSGATGVFEITGYIP
jgi:hypothetical protein